MQKEYAPIIVFCYNRPQHLARTLEALNSNALAKDSHLAVFSDGYKGEKDRDEVLAVRQYLDRIEGFGKVEIHKSKKNRGLSASVIEGVTGVIREYGRVIVLEDDMVVTSDFLGYMNSLLDVYQTRSDIFSVTAYGPPIEVPPGYSQDLYLAHRSSTWGWGTWADRWELADWGSANYEQLIDSPELKERFIRGGNDLWPMLYKQQRGLIDSWGVRWCLTQSLHNGYGVYPVKTKLRNIGTDGSGTNFTFKADGYDGELNFGEVETDYQLAPDKDVLQAFRQFYDLPFGIRIKNFLRYGI